MRSAVGVATGSVWRFDTEDVLIVPHAHQAGDWRLSDPEMERLIEIQSTHGTFEWFGNYYGNADMASRVSFWGGRDECLDKLGQLVQAGAKHLILNPVLDEMEHLELLSEEIVPYL